MDKKMEIEGFRIEMAIFNLDLRS